MTNISKSISVILQLVQLTFFFILVVFVFHFRIFPYADDWIYVEPLNMNAITEFITWSFKQHVDHRIPIQKVIQFALARYSWYDFRVLVFFNIIIALFTSLMLISIAKTYRGYQHIGDIIIPMIIMSPMAAYSLWAFQFQFLSCIFFVSANIYFACQYTKTGKTYYATLSLMQLFLCTLCGMNGAIFSTVLISGIITYLFYESRQGNKVDKWLITFAMLVLFENIIIWLLWEPSSASEPTTDLIGIVGIFFRMLPASMITFTSFHAIAWKIVIIIAALMLTFYGFYRSLKKIKLNFSDIILILSILASLAVLFSIAIARSKIQGGWSYTLPSHYGYLTIFLPIITWLIISKFFSSKISLLISIIGIVIFTRTYLENYTFRHNMEKPDFKEQSIINNALKENPDIHALVDKYVLEFTWKNDVESKQPVINGISTLRTRGFPIYFLNLANSK